NLKTGGAGFPASYPDFADWRDRQHSFDGMAAFRRRSMTLVGAGEPVRVAGASVTADLFPLLGVAPRLGRVFNPNDDKAGNHAVILGSALWRSRFNADPAVMGKAVSIDGTSYTVVGVMPPDFAFPLDGGQAELWIGTAIDDEGEARLTVARGWHGIEGIGRLKPGVTLATAQADLSQIAAAVAREHPEVNVDMGVLATPLYRRLVGDVRPALLLLFGAVGCVLLIACGNVANLQLGHAAGRRREMAVRSALGATRGRIVRQMLAEGLLLSLAGGAAGLLLAIWGTGLLLRLAPQSLPRVADTALDPGVLAFSFLITILTGLLFALAPTLQVSRSNLVTALKEGGRGGSEGKHTLRWRRFLVTAQVCATFVLLTGAGLLLNTFHQLQRVKPGFDSQNLLTFRLSLPGTRYKDPDKIQSFYRELTARIGALPGVASIGVTSALPLSGDSFYAGVAIQGEPIQPKNPYPYVSSVYIVGPDYFRTLGIELLQGRCFNAGDASGSNQVVVVNQAFARNHFPNGNPLGRLIQATAGGDKLGFPWRQVVGVIKDVDNQGLQQAATPECYVPFSQLPVGTLSLAVRTAVEPRSLVPELEREVHALDSEIPLYGVRNMDDYVAGSMAQARFNTFLLSLFAGAALLLTAVGLYGVLSWTVTQRRTELGIRLALGASARAVAGLVIRQGVGPVFVGLALGIAAALPLTRLVEAYLFGVRPHDPLTYIGMVMLLILTALIACYIPARRATNVDPMTTLRCD
ncbi:MAG TPA: ABC transporter permease, partial [Blastocatellia bacterium]|nr:ABC transporter permease [Blastocatellia bacterium]